MNCALCLQEKILCDSHIYPEFFYKKVYEENHIFYGFRNDPEVRPKLHRKGVYEPLLCKDCEEHINKYEDYAAKVLFGGVQKTIEQFPEKIVAGELLYDKFKLFELSLLWRSGVSKLPEFANIKLARHEEILRKMIYDDNPGEQYDYGCFISFIPNVQELMNRMVYPLEPLNRKIWGFQIYRGIFGGLFWAFVVSSHNKEFPYPDIFISKSGVLQVFKAPPVANDFLYDLGKDMASSVAKVIKRNA